MKTLNLKFDTIESLRTNPTITNLSEAYLEACNQFELQASEFSTNTSFFCRKSAEEVSLAFHKAKGADSEYAIYRAAHACEIWLKETWNCAD